MAAGGETLGRAPGTIVSKRLRPFAARHLGVLSAAESASSAGPHGRTAAAHEALGGGGSAAGLECMAQQPRSLEHHWSISPRRPGQ